MHPVRPLLASLLISLGGIAHAAWSTDPALNLAIADRPGEQVIPKIACTQAGDCYVAWFDNAFGGYRVYIQHLDAAGNELYPHNGILLSNHPQDTSLVDWDLIVDTEGNAIVVFTDIRAGGDLDVYAYKVAPDGTLPWGADGVALSDNPDYDPSPVVCEATDGDLVFVWASMPNSGDGTLRMQRLAPDGTPRFAQNGVVIAAAAGDTPAFAKVVPAEDGRVIVSWVRDILPFNAPRHLRAGKFNVDGTTTWGPVTVYDSVSLPIAYWPELGSDGQGGAVLVWHRSQANLYNSLVQHLASDGTELFPHQGVAVSTLGGMYHIDPAFAYREDTQEIFVFWNEENTVQSQYGIYGQKLDAAGNRAWGANGIAYVAVSPVLRYPPRVVAAGDGAMVFWADEPGGVFNQDRVLGLRVDAGGASVWPGAPIVVSSVLSSKARLPVVIDGAQNARLVWEDSRHGAADVYGQAVKGDGSLGASTTAAPSLAGSAPGLLAWPNPFSTETRIVAPGVAAPLAVFDLRGRRVRSLGSLARWDGRDDHGRPLPAGTYLVGAGSAWGRVTRVR